MNLACIPAAASQVKERDREQQKRFGNVTKNNKINKTDFHGEK